LDSNRKVVVGGSFTVEANANTILSEVPVVAGHQDMFLIRYRVGGQEYGNHYLLGKPPFSFKQYVGWLKDISGLPEKFKIQSIFCK
jgi:hypothetical protein